MGIANSIPASVDAQRSVVFYRIGTTDASRVGCDLPSFYDLLSVAGTSHPFSCIQFDGDWFRLMKPSESGRSRLQVVCSSVTPPFVSAEPPTLKKLHLLPRKTDTPLLERNRTKIVLPYLSKLEPLSVFFQNGDVLPHNGFVVVDCEPEAGGRLSVETEVFVEGPPLLPALRVTFAPINSTQSPATLLSYLAHMGNLLLLHKNRVIQDFNQFQWRVVLIDPPDTRSVFSSHTRVFIHASQESLATVQIDEVFSVSCLRCHRTVRPPFNGHRHFAFACPRCRFLNPHPHYPLWVDLNLAPPGPGKHLVQRIQESIVLIRSGQTHRIMEIQALLDRLPRLLLTGRLDWNSLDLLAQRLLPPDTMMTHSESTGTHQDVIDRLPVCLYPGHGTGQEEERCEICLDSFVDTQIKTLPCFHRFHVHCCDAWLHVSKTCPLCKNNVETVVLDH